MTALANRFTAAIAKVAPVATRPFPLPGVFVGSDKPLVIHCCHAGWGNPELSDAMIKAGPARREVEKMPEGHARILADARIDVQVYRFAIVGWDNAFEDDGAPLVLTPELAGDLLSAVVEGHFGLFVTWKFWVSAAQNFTDTIVGDPAALGK